MLYVRSRRLRTGTFYYLVTGRHTRPRPCGSGPAGKEYAENLLAELRLMLRDEKAGRGPRAVCAWTLEHLSLIDLAEARRRGLRTALPQFQGKQSRRESHWNNLLGFFGRETNLEDLTGERIRAYIEEHGAVGGNRDLWGVLRPALRLARDHEESGYRADPFRGIRKSAERPREGIDLGARRRDALVRLAWERDPELAAQIEFLLLTYSRLRQVGEIVRGVLRFPPHKKGRARAFLVRGRLAAVLRLPRSFDYLRWRDLVEAFGLPELRPHDLRHTALSIHGRTRGATLESLMKRGGWKDPAMAARYLHPDAAAIEPEQARRQARRRPKKRKRAA